MINKLFKRKKKLEHKLFFWKRTVVSILVATMLSGSFSMILSNVSWAYNTVPGGQLRLESGVCYNGQDPNHPFQYSTNYMPLYYNTMSDSFPYLRGNDGAGGNVGGTTTIVQKRINTGQGWSSVPLYRVSRSGGYSDNLIAATGDRTDIVTADEIYSAVNSLSGINRQINYKEANMIQKVMQNGFKAGWSETHATGYDYGWEENRRCIATQVLIWEIQEGKRWSLADGHYRQEADTVGYNPYYWRDWYNNLWANTGYGTNWYEQILSMCRAQDSPLEIACGNMGKNVTATRSQGNTGTIYADYLAGPDQFQASFYVADPALRGEMAGQYSEKNFQWIPDDGSAPAHIGWSGGVGYLTSDYAGQSGFSGWIKITQNRDEYNDVGYMQGGSTNAWRGFLFGGNRATYEVYLRVECTGDNRVKVKFVDSVTGSPVNVNWTFEASGIATEFTENSSGKSFVPNYWTNSGGANANYNIFVNSVPGDYYMPLNNWTGFNFWNSVVKFGEGGTGWGYCDYEKAGASFDGNNITIRVQKKTPINIKFVDYSTGQPVKVDWSFYEYVDGVTLSENSSGTSFIPKYYERERWQANNEIQVKGVPEGYEMPQKIESPFVYDNWGGVVKWGDGGTGWVGNTTTGQWNNGDYDKSGASFNGNTITIRLRQLNNIEVEFVDSETGQTVDVNWQNEPLIVKTPVDTFTNNGKVSFVPEYWSKNHKSSWYTIKILDSKGYFLPKADTIYAFNGATVSETSLCNYPQAQAEINGNKITIKLIKEHSPINIRFVDKQDGVTPVDVTGIVTEQGSDGKGSYDRNFFGSSYTYKPATIGDNLISLTGVDSNHIFAPNSGNNQVYTFDYGQNWLPGYSNNNAFKNDVIIEGDTVTVLIERKNDVFYDTLPIRIAYRDKKTGKPVNVEWEFSSRFTDDLNGNGNRVDIEANPDAFYNIGEKDYSMYFNMRSYAPEGYEEIDDVDLFYTGLALYDSEGNENGYLNFNENIRFAKNTITISVVPKEVKDNVQVEFIKPNSDYHYGEEVFSSFYVKNLGEKNYNPTDGTLDLEMKIEKFNGSEWGTFFSKSQNGVIVPGNGTQLAYFKWTVPTLPLFTGNEKYRIVSTVSYGGVAINTSTSDIKIASFVSSATPPAKFDLDGGKYFVLTNPIVKNQDYQNSATWQQYEWIDGKYAIKTYSNKLWTKSITIKPDETNPSATFNTGTKLFTSRSGYAIKLALKPELEQFEVSGGTLTPIVKEASTTAVQRANAYFSENGFTNALEKYDTLELIDDNTFGFRVFEKSTYQVGERGDGRKHFIPMWFPDKEYVVQCVSSSCWSPAGMLSYTDESNKIMINGSLYDDWYSSGNGR